MKTSSSFFALIALAGLALATPACDGSKKPEAKAGDKTSDFTEKKPEVAPPADTFKGKDGPNPPGGSSLNGQ